MDETATGDNLVQAILTERLHELPLEFKIWDDIRRTRLSPEASTENWKVEMDCPFICSDSEQA